MTMEALPTARPSSSDLRAFLATGCLRQAEVGAVLSPEPVLRLVETGVLALSSGLDGPAVCLVSPGQIDGLPRLFNGVGLLHATVIRNATWREVMIDALPPGVLVDLIGECASATARRFDQLAMEATCVMRHKVGRRMARWLLAIQAGQGGDPIIRLEQDLIGRLLAVRRTTINGECQYLRKLGAIRTIRGRIEIKDPALLLAVACSCGTSETPSPLNCSEEQEHV